MSGWAVIFEIPIADLRSKDPEHTMYEWLGSHFGLIDYSKSAGNWRWTYKPVNNGLRIYFRDPKDATLFKLTWL